MHWIFLMMYPLLKLSNLSKILYIVLYIIFLHLINGHFLKNNYNEYENQELTITTNHQTQYLLTNSQNSAQIHYQIIERELSALEYMVDLSNELAYRIMYYHSILNHNNFVFSPIALMSILVALYEGAAGQSAYQLKQALHLPNNRDIIRIGNRDIQRRLRTYFFQTENPLKGLSLNKDNVTITKNYEILLAFYGYELNADMISSLNDFSQNNISDKKTNIKDVKTFHINIPKTNIYNITTSTPFEESQNKKTNTLNSTSEFNLISTIKTSEISYTSELLSINENNSVSTLDIMEYTTGEKELSAVSSTIKSITSESTTTELIAINNTSVEINGETNENAEIISPFVTNNNIETFARIQKTNLKNLPSSELESPLFLNTPRRNYLPAQKKILPNTNNNEQMYHKRTKRNLFNGQEIQTNFKHHNIETNKNHEFNFLPKLISHSTVLGIPDSNNFHNYLNRNTKHNYNTDIINHIFYLNNHRTVHTIFKVYNSVLYHKYFEHWHMNVIELELDTPEYNLMILLPDFNIDLLSVSATLNFPNLPNLRKIREKLKPKWVQATIPDFGLHGTIFVTNDLQNIGIIDIFEPNRADFRPMTNGKGTYVKHIQQYVKIYIRTHGINQLKDIDRLKMQPIQISVNHPFIFFIIDRDLNLAVMTGRVLDPLNVRIQ